MNMEIETIGSGTTYARNLTPPPGNCIVFLGFSNPVSDLVKGLEYLSAIPYHEYYSDAAKAQDRLRQLLLLHTARHISIVLCARWVQLGQFQILRFLSEHPQLKFCPVLVIAERIFITDGNRFMEYGADDFYHAPVEAAQLEDRISFLQQFKADILQKRKRISFRRPQQLRPSIRPLKRLIDIAVAGAALIVLFPLMLLVAAAIRLESKGPVIYRSKRVGHRYREFDFWKFRSMYINADQMLEQMKTQNQYGSDAVFVKFAKDPRVTRVGRVIRKFSIDELPQLFNILKGDMSIVGNRPLPLYEARHLLTDERDASARFLAPAGLTGLWQVQKRGKSDMSYEERIALDVEYTHSWNLAKDMKIMFQTLTAFIQKEDV